MVVGSSIQGNIVIRFLSKRFYRQSETSNEACLARSVMCLLCDCY
jgi:hypothetical protein